MKPLGYSISEKLQFEKNIPDISLPHGRWKLSEDWRSEKIMI